MIHSCAQLIEYIQQVGFLPLLDNGIRGFSAEELVDDDCRYQVLPDGGWEWPLWKWKGEVVTEGGCMYGKFFMGKACFVSREWWADLMNVRRQTHPDPEEGGIEDTILAVLREQGSLITRELRKACGFTGPKMRSKFDGYVTRLQMGCRIVTEDFIYPQDRHGRPYGWGWSLLSTPEQLYGHELCHTERSHEESYQRLLEHFRHLLPQADERLLEKIIK